MLVPTPTAPKPVKIRGALTLGKRIRILVFRDRNPLYNVATVASLLGRTPAEIKTVTRKRRETLIAMSNCPKRHLRRRVRLGRYRGCDFPISEQELYKHFLHQRFVLGREQHEIDLKLKMRQIVDSLEEGTEADRKKFSVSNGWLEGFKKRHRIVSRAKTEKKSLSFAERKSSVTSFHRGMWVLQNILHPLRDLIWGHWVPSQIYNMDQIPLPFCLSSKRSLNPKAGYCWIRDVGKGGLDKRQASIVLTIRAQGDQDIECVLLVAGSGRQITQEEYEFYRGLKNVKVYFQQKAWCDGKVMAWWVRKIWKRDANPSRLLVLDCLSCHVSQETLQSLASQNTHVVNPPPNCTDLIAPIDHHVGKWLKDKMKKRYCAALSEHWETWRDSSQNDSLAAPKRRMMMAGWLDDAMNELKDPKMASFLYASFDSTGVLVKRDGTHNIKIRGGKDYKFP